MNDKNDDTTTLYKSCVIFALAPLVMAWEGWVAAYVGHTIWSWYPPFRLRVPSVPELYVIFVLVRLARGKKQSGRGSPTSEEWFEALFGTLVPFLLLAAVAILRWFYS